MNRDEIKMQMVMICTAIGMIDTFGGSCDIHENDIEKFFNDDNECACALIESTGEVIRIAEMDYKEIMKAIDLWRKKNPEKMEQVMTYLDNQC